MLIINTESLKRDSYVNYVFHETDPIVTAHNKLYLKYFELGAITEMAVVIRTNGRVIKHHTWPVFKGISHIKILIPNSKDFFSITYDNKN